MNKSKKIFLALGAAILLSSCATTKLNPVYVTNTKKLNLLPVTSIKNEIDSYQLFEGKFGDKSLSSLVYLTADSKGINVVMLSDIGVTLGEMSYDGESCTTESSILPSKLKAEYIILDLQNAYADYGELKAHYGQKKLDFLEEKKNGKIFRKIMNNGNIIEEIIIDEKSVVIKNILREYEYKLTASEE